MLVISLHNTWTRRLMRQHRNVSRAKGRRFEPRLCPRLLHRYSRTETERSLIVFVVHHTGKWTMRTGKSKRKKVSLLEKDDWPTVYSVPYDVWLGFFAVSLVCRDVCAYACLQGSAVHWIVSWVSSGSNENFHSKTLISGWSSW